METLLEGVSEEPRALLLTHIHLDHAGATGALVERFPDLEVWVHARGAPHLVDPAKLLASAERIYGDRMEPLWGRVVPVPGAQPARARGRRDDRGRGPRRSTSSTRPGTPPTTSSTSTTPTAPPTSATSPACGSRPPTSCSRRRRRRTSTSRPGCARSTWSPRGSRARLALTHFGVGGRPAAAPRADEAGACDEQAELARRLLDGARRHRRGGAGVRRRGEPASPSSAPTRETAAGRSRSARRSSSGGWGCAATGRKQAERGAAAG